MKETYYWEKVRSPPKKDDDTSSESAFIGEMYVEEFLNFTIEEASW